MSWLRCTTSSTRTGRRALPGKGQHWRRSSANIGGQARARCSTPPSVSARKRLDRSEEHTSELQSRLHLVCRLLLEKKKKMTSLNRMTIELDTAHHS